jgi:hypothetical protein
MLIVPASKFMMPPAIVITPNVPNVIAPADPNVIAKLAAITIPPTADTLTAPAPVKFKKVAVLKLIWPRAATWKDVQGEAIDPI